MPLEQGHITYLDFELIRLGQNVVVKGVSQLHFEVEGLTFHACSSCWLVRFDIDALGLVDSSRLHPQNKR